MKLLNCIAATLTASFCAHPAMAQSIRGEIGEQSRATIGISVSVMPTFALSRSGNEGPPEASAQGFANGLKLASNTSGIRYTLVPQAPEETKANQWSPVTSSAGIGKEAVRAGGGGEPKPASLLILVVPD